MEWPEEYDHVFALLDCVKKRYDYWSARCPGHDDEHPSLSVRIGSEGLLIRCHAGDGCRYENILAELARIAQRPICCKPYNGQYAETARRRRMEEQPKLEREHIYMDEKGEPEFRVQIFRYPSSLKKDVKQHAADKSKPGQWKPNMEGARRILYGLPELIVNKNAPKDKRRPVVIVEGEQKADDLRKIGVLATSASGGAGKFHLTYPNCGVLADCHLIVIPDNNAPDEKTGKRAGWDHAMQVCNLMHTDVSRIQVVTVPAGDGQDISDWLPTIDGDAKAKKLALWELVKKAPDYDPLRAGAPLPPFLCAVMNELISLRREKQGRLFSPEEGLGYMDVSLHAVRGALAYAKRSGEKMTPADMARLFAQIAADAMRTVEDLGLLNQKEER